jgi:hypothetical protein
MLGEELDEIGGAAQEDGIVEEMAAADVAVAAEEGAHEPVGVVVVDVRRARERLPADEAEAVLACEHLVEVCARESVPRQPAASFVKLLGLGDRACAIPGIGSVTELLLREDAIAIGLVPGASLRSGPGATGGLLRICVVGRLGHGSLLNWRRSLAPRAMNARRRAADGGEDVGLGA